MEKIVFTGARYGSTVFKIREGQISLCQLFGMDMDWLGQDRPKRLRGAEDFAFDFDAFGTEAAQITRWENKEDELRIEYQAGEGRLEFSTVWKYDGELGIFSRRDIIYNPGDAEAVVYGFQPKFIFSPGNYECYVQNSSWCYEDKGAWEPVGRFGGFLQSEGGRTTQGGAPFLALRRSGDGKGVAFHIVPKGNWEIRLQKVSAGGGFQGKEMMVLRLGQSRERFSFCLSPGEKLEMPELVIQALPEGKLYRETESLQRWLIKNDTSQNRCSHKVVYNPWYSCYNHINESDMLEHARTAQRIGCEVFEIDAGWYGQGNDWSSSTGDWSERLDGAFYGRLREFSEQIRAMGMGFGLWMEPERIAKGTAVYREHPHWFAGGSGGCCYPKLWEKEPYDYIKGEMLRLIEYYKLVWMKVDFNFELEEDETKSQFLLYYESWYRLIDELKELHPEVFMEACASGGLRTDINTMRHFDGHFISDNVNPYEGQRMYEQLMIRTFPTKVYQWLAVQKGADVPAYFREMSDIEKSVIVPAAPGAGFGDHERMDMDFLCKLMFRGMVGITGNITTLEDEELNTLKAYISFYKKFRHHLENSVVTIDSEPTDTENRDYWRTMDYYYEQKDAHLLYIYRFGEIRSFHQVFAGHIREDITYQVMRKENREKISGRNLKKYGLEVELKSRNIGEIIYICPDEE